MKEMRLMQIIGDIDEKYIDEAAPAEQKKKAMRFTPWVRYASIAACAMLVIGVGLFAMIQQRGNIVDNPVLSGTQTEEAGTAHSHAGCFSENVCRRIAVLRFSAC